MATKSTGKTPGSTTRTRNTTRKTEAVTGGAAAAMAPEKPARPSKKKAAAPEVSETSVAAPAATPVINYGDAVRERAYQLFEERGCQHGHDVEDWLRAEYEISTRTR